MAVHIRRVDYFYVNVRDQPGEAYRLLTALAARRINLLAFTAVPTGEARAQLTIFPDDPQHLISEARNAALALDGPYHALLVQGDDELGTLADVHHQLFDAGVNVYAASGVADGRHGFGYLIYIRPEDFEKAAHTLGV